MYKISCIFTASNKISYVNAEFTNCGLTQLIDIELGVRGLGTGYSYSEIFRAWNNVFFCGGKCAEDIQVHLREALEQIPQNNMPGADTMLRGVKELAEANTEVTVPGSKKVYRFNLNEKMNRLNIKSLLLTKQLEKGGCYDFDYDNISTGSKTVKSSATGNTMQKRHTKRYL